MDPGDSLSYTNKNINDSKESIIPQEETPPSPLYDPAYIAEALANYHTVKKENKKKDSIIASLRKTNSELQIRVWEFEKKERQKPKKRILIYDYALFPPKVDADKIVEMLIELVTYQKSKNKWLISNSRDWFIVWRVLRSHNWIRGTLTGFCNLINDTVLDALEDCKRKQSIICDINNFTSIKDDYPPKRFEPSSWISNYQADPKNTKSLNRAINIKKVIENLLNFND